MASPPCHLEAACQDVRPDVPLSVYQPCSTLIGTILSIFHFTIYLFNYLIMPQDVQLQSDLGALSLQGLGAFSSVLAILSADDIAPLALIQVEKLGAAFPTSSPCAEKVKTLLQRCSSVRLDRLAMAVGWRKNDTASLMGESAGGQAASLLCLCLTNLLYYEDAGLVLSRLSSAMLPHKSNLAAVPQLAEIAKVLSGKLSTLGFGNHLAREVKRFQDSYEAMGKKPPADLLQKLNADSIIGILQLSSEALINDKKFCRITGSQSMCLVGGLLQVLFCRDISIIVEGVEIQTAHDCKILLDLSSGVPTRIDLEAKLDTSQGDFLPIKVQIKDEHSENWQKNRLTKQFDYNWDGWLADNLTLEFSHWGYVCSQSMLDACSYLVLPILKQFEVSSPLSDKSLTRQSLSKLLGHRSKARVQASCKILLRSIQTAQNPTLREAFEHLQMVMDLETNETSCSCGLNCEWYHPWIRHMEKEKQSYCKYYQLWSAIGYTITTAVICVFVNADQNAVACPRDGSLPGSLSKKSANMILGRDPEGYAAPMHYDISQLWLDISEIAQPRGFPRFSILAAGSSSSTVFPTVLQSMCVPLGQETTFEYVAGRIFFENRYHQLLQAEQVSWRAERSAGSPANFLEPTNLGTHDGEPLVTIREGFNFLELSCSIKCRGLDVKLNLRSVVSGYLGMHWSDSCSHISSRPLANDDSRFTETDVANPAAEGALGIVMTRGSPMAQFFACEQGYQAILIRDSCLNCTTSRLIAQKINISDPVVLIMG